MWRKSRDILPKEQEKRVHLLFSLSVCLSGIFWWHSSGLAKTQTDRRECFKTSSRNCFFTEVMRLFSFTATVKLLQGQNKNIKIASEGKEQFALNFWPQEYNLSQEIRMLLSGQKYWGQNEKLCSFRKIWYKELFGHFQKLLWKKKLFFHHLLNVLPVFRSVPGGCQPFHQIVKCPTL